MAVNFVNTRGRGRFDYWGVSVIIVKIVIVVMVVIVVKRVVVVKGCWFRLAMQNVEVIMTLIEPITMGIM